MAVQQWTMLVALNYAAKGKGVKRGMHVVDAMKLCPDIVLVHVATIVEKVDAKEGSQLDSYNPSTISSRGFKQNGEPIVEIRDKESQKICLRHYREESKKIFKILRRYCQLVENASCDEAFLDISHEVELKY